MREAALPDEPRSFIVPYAFYNEQFQLGLGGAYGVSGYPQPQSSAVVSLIGSTNASWAFFPLGHDYQLPIVHRLFLDPWISVSGVKDLRAYSDGNPDFPDERAGSNDSDADNFIEGDGSDVFANFTFKYLLPLGHGKTTIINTYEVDRGLLVAGATGGGWWNPLQRGRSYIEVEPFYRR